MSPTQMITALSVMEIVEREKAATGLDTIALIMLALVALNALLMTGVFQICDTRQPRGVKVFATVSAVAVAIGSFVGVPAMIFINNEVKRPGRHLEPELQTAVAAELSEKYRFQEVELTPPVDDTGTSLGIYSWIDTLYSDALEPATVLVRLEEGPTVPYELRLVQSTVDLYPLHGDTTVPDPQELRH